MRLAEKAKQSSSLLGGDAYSSYWLRWVNEIDFLKPATNIRKIYGDYFTPVRWRSENYVFRLLVSLELIVTSFLSSPKAFLRTIFKPNYWRLSKICRKQGRHMNFVNIIALSAFNLICSRVKSDQLTICIIGDGASNFVVLSHMASPKFKKIISINLSEVHLVETEMLLKAGISESELTIIDSKLTAQEFFLSESKIAVVSADDVQYLTDLKIDIFVNLSSMQEMTTVAISEYFSLIKSSNSFFYCCNRKEKKLPDGSEIRFSEYPWGDARFLINEQCPWMKRTFNLTRPFIRRQEIHHHALVEFAS
mgnify:CR=1 FL=1